MHYAKKNNAFLERRSIPFLFFLIFFTSLRSLFAFSNGHDIGVAPFISQEIVDIIESEEFFQDSPVYNINNPRQFLLRNDWSGTDDFSCQVKLFWSSDSIFFQFSVVDDTFLPASSFEKDKINGDFIKINLAHLTCGPDQNALVPWSILLLPDPQKENVKQEIQVQYETTRAKLGKIESVIFRTIDGYSLIVKLPYGQWDDVPRAGGMTRFQILFGDSDTPGQVDHKFLLFPVDRGISNPLGKTPTYGNIRYADQSWVTVYPKNMVYSNHEAEFFVDVGNLSEKEIAIEVYPEVKADRQTFNMVDEKYQVTYELQANSIEQKVPIKCNLKGLPSGTYRINASAGTYYDSGAFVLKYSERSGLSYCPNLIDRRKKTKKRSLEIYKNSELNSSTFRQMAGGGEVLWSVGTYDASSEEFPQYIRKMGSHTLQIPKDGNKGVPWALFGGLDNLDGMNEPLVINIDPEQVDAKFPFTPDRPLIQSTKNPSKATRDSYKFLLLVGVLVDFVDQDSFPKIHIRSSNERTLVKQEIRPSDFGGRNKRHVFVFRIWLSSLENEILIENSAINGSKFELDFLALLGGAENEEFLSLDSSLQFDGTSEAEMFNKQLSSTLFFAKNFLVNSDGTPNSSLPGGRYSGVNLRDWGLLTSELAAWGFIEKASSLCKKLPLFLGSESSSQGSNGFSIGEATAITGIYNTWCKIGKNKAFLDPIWLSCVHRPITKLVKEIETNPLGLVNCVGDFGVDGTDTPAATLPMYFAIQAALESSVEMARKSGFSQNAVSWKSASERMKNSFRRHLVSPSDQTQLVSPKTFPASWGIGEQQGIVSLLPQNVWVYGRFEDEKPVFYNKNTRVFDTPYLLSGMLFWSDYSGFILDEQTDAQLKTSFDFVQNFCPLFRNRLWRKYSVIQYDKSATHLWAVLSGFYLDSIPIASDMMESFIRYSYDEFVPIPEFCDIEISPYTFEERFNVSESGLNNGADGDDMNILTTVSALKIARLFAGIDDYQSSGLRLIPRLPTDWKKVQAKNWMITHDATNSGIANIQYSYERVGDNRYSLILESSQKLNDIFVRVGPFSPKIRKVRISEGDHGSDINTIRHGFYSWAEITFKKKKSLELVAQAIIY